MDKLNFKKIINNDFKHIYQDMLEQFPKYELKSYENFEKLISSGKLDCYGVYDNDLEIGYFLLAKTGKSFWLDYIAIKKPYQSKGYGRKIMQHFDNCYLEVEKPDLNKPDTLRRIKFYEALGAKKLDIDYVYPNDQGGYTMDLYYLGKNIPENITEDIKYIFKILHSKDI